MTKPKGFETQAVHAGQEDPDKNTGSRAVPIAATSSFVFDSADHAAAIFSGSVPGNQYGRMHNPTTKVLEDRLNTLEGGARTVALSSGQAATTALLFSLAKPDAQLLISKEVFGGTMSVVRKLLHPWGCRIESIDPTPEAVASHASRDTVGVWVETIANPSLTVPNISALAEACHKVGAPLVVDNTWGCAGYLCKPLELGADIVTHSATKWIGGHGTFIGGAVIDGGTFDWSTERFPAFGVQDVRGKSYLQRDPVAPFAARVHDLGLFAMGMTLSPFSAFLALQGLETLPIRVQRICDSALDLARWFDSQDGVKRVLYPGLPTHSSHGVASKVLQNGNGGVFCFETESVEQAKAFLDRVEIASHLANIGDVKTVVISPWATTHSSLSEEARYGAGVTPELIRVSVGLESAEDLKQDFRQALDWDSSRS
jgi:O-acetylhomoserine/O-acetylserine sulfhydrylase